MTARVFYYKVLFKCLIIIKLGIKSNKKNLAQQKNAASAATFKKNNGKQKANLAVCFFYQLVINMNNI